MAMREGETLKTYSDRYWETYNEIDGNFEDVAVRTFKVGLPVEYELRKSLMMKFALNMRQLMDCIDKYKQVEEDHIQGKRDSAPRPALGTINVIFAKLGNGGGSAIRVMFVSGGCDLEASDQAPKRARLMVTPTLGFLEEDKEGTLQSYNDTLVVTTRIGGYDINRVLVDQGSRVEILYPDLYKGLNLKFEDLERYDSPLIGFDGRMVVP
nr:hypothetical protein CFP56_74354 [Quercus suber]